MLKSGPQVAWFLCLSSGHKRQISAVQLLSWFLGYKSHRKMLRFPTWLLDYIATSISVHSDLAIVLGPKRSWFPWKESFPMKHHPFSSNNAAMSKRWEVVGYILRTSPKDPKECICKIYIFLGICGCAAAGSSKNRFRPSRVGNVVGVRISLPSEGSS